MRGSSIVVNKFIRSSSNNPIVDLKKFNYIHTVNVDEACVCHIRSVLTSVWIVGHVYALYGMSRCGQASL